jgi:hypothetical protein
VFGKNPLNEGSAFDTVLPLTRPVLSPYIGQVWLLEKLHLHFYFGHAWEKELEIEELEKARGPIEETIQLNLYVSGQRVWSQQVTVKLARLHEGPGGPVWIGEAEFSSDFVNPIYYRSGQSLTFSISGSAYSGAGGAQSYVFFFGSSNPVFTPTGEHRSDAPNNSITYTQVEGY